MKVSQGLVLVCLLWLNASIFDDQGTNSNSANPFPQLTSSIHVPSPSFFGHDIFLHHHRDLVVDQLLPAIENVATTRPNGGHPSEILARKKLANRDRHRKILTAQGPRDRRVRLSIQIARKFFDLQEMLGLDKASKTLDWLLTKSKTAIQELEKMKLSCSDKSFSSTNSECEEAQGNRVLKRKPLTSGTKEKRILRQPHKSDFLLLAKESRAKARARARERTREKMCIRKLGELKKLPVSLLPPIVNQSNSWNQIETRAKLGSYNASVDAEKIITQTISRLPLVNNEDRWKEIIGESNIVIKRKSKASQTFGYQQNLIMSKELSSYSNNYSPNITENCEISTITPVVPPTELQNCGKAWEVYTNRISRA